MYILIMFFGVCDCDNFCVSMLYPIVYCGLSLVRFVSVTEFESFCSLFITNGVIRFSCHFVIAFVYLNENAFYEMKILKRKEMSNTSIHPNSENKNEINMNHVVVCTEHEGRNASCFKLLCFFFFALGFIKIKHTQCHSHGHTATATP